MTARIILIASLFGCGCSYRNLPGDHITERAKACIDAGLSVKVFERNDKAIILCEKTK